MSYGEETAERRNMRWALISAMSQMDIPIISAQSGMRICIVGYAVGASANTSMWWKAGASVLLSGKMYPRSNGISIVSVQSVPSAPVMVCPVNTSFMLRPSNTPRITGWVQYYYEGDVTY